jgi:hypothetical protein
MPSSTTNGTTQLVTDSLLLKGMLSEGSPEQALELSESLLERSRSVEERDHQMEAWLRMERALLGAIGSEHIGTELRWCVDRLAATSPSSPLHGLALLNLGAWHRNRGESMMALVTLSDVSSPNGHPNDIIGLSRLESGRILREMGDFEPAMRHLWIAMSRLADSKMTGEALVSGMEWLDMALDDVDPSSPRMSERIANARPREAPGNTSIASHPDDIREVVEIILPVVLKDLSGETRDDLGLVLDAGDLIGEPAWSSMLESRKAEIQDNRLIEALQS